MKITWKIERLDCIPNLDGVKNYAVTAYWRANAEDGDHHASVYGTCSFQVPEQAPDTYTPFDKLTEDMVLGWVWMSGVDKDSAEATLAAQIETQKNPPVVAPPLPWAVRG